MKLKIILLVLSLSVFAGCGTKKEEANTQETVQETSPEETVQEEEPVKEVTVYVAHDEVGEGTMEVLPAEMTVSKDTLLTQIEIDTNVSSDLLTFTYIDGTFIEKATRSESQYTVNITGDLLSQGEHTVEVIQYEGDDESGTIAMCKVAKFTIK